jgi:hypothetical protein
MNRMKMLEMARQRACEMVDESCCLNDTEYTELKALPNETAIDRLAVFFLEEALADHKPMDKEELKDAEDAEDCDEDYGEEDED